MSSLMSFTIYLHPLFFYFGLGSLTISWFIYLFAVSKMDLSYVLPIHASSYICNALLAWLILGENVSFFTLVCYRFYFCGGFYRWL